MKLDIVTDLIGKVVEIRGDGDDSNRWFDRVVARGRVRAVYDTNYGITVLIEHERDGSTSMRATVVGGLESFPICDSKLVREVVQCMWCAGWKHPSECATRIYGPASSQIYRYVCEAQLCQERNCKDLERSP